MTLSTLNETLAHIFPGGKNFHGHVTRTGATASTPYGVDHLTPGPGAAYAVAIEQKHDRDVNGRDLLIAGLG